MDSSRNDLSLAGREMAMRAAQGWRFDMQEDGVRLSMRVRLDGKQRKEENGGELWRREVGRMN